jgi:predicted GIY-YIG superfamily endonuclease
MAFYAYMLHCNGGYFYTGQTEDMDVRLAQHEQGLVPGFTRDHRPVKLVWCELFPTRDEAKAAERRIKGWSRAKKLALIRGDWAEVSRLAKSRKQGQAFDRLRLDGVGYD